MTIPQYEDIDRCNVELMKLIDHITSGADDVFAVYGPHGSVGRFADYQAALDAFNTIEEKGHSYIALWTRIGTAAVVLSKSVE